MPQVPNIIKPSFNNFKINWSNRITKNLIGCWLLNEGKGINTKDLAKKANGTFINGTRWEKGKSGNCVSFDGIDDKINLGNPSSLQVDGLISIFSIIFPKTFGSGSRGSIFDKGNNSSTGPLFRIDNSNIAASLSYFQNGAESKVCSTANLISLNTWQSVGMSNNIVGTNGFFYVNGSRYQDNAIYGTTLLSNTTTNASIGGRTIDTTRQFDGFIELVYVWNRIVTPVEFVMLHFNPYCFIVRPEDDYSFNGLSITPPIIVPSTNRRRIILTS